MLKTNQGEIFQYCKIIDEFFFYRHVLADWKPTNETTWLFAFSLQCFPNTYMVFRTTVKKTATGKDHLVMHSGKNDCLCCEDYIVCFFSVGPINFSMNGNSSRIKAKFCKVRICSKGASLIAIRN